MLIRNILACARAIAVPILAVSWLMLSSAVSAQERRPLTTDDLFELRRIGSPVVSPEGEWIAYTVTTTSLEEESSETMVWMAPREGGDPLPMTTPGTSASNPQWSPDGRYLSFTASRGGGDNQVWVLDRRGGEARPLTAHKGGISGYRWSPDGTRLLLTIRDPKPEAEEEWAGGKKDAPQAPWVVDRLQFKRDGTGYLTGNRHTHLFTFDLASETLTQITSGDHDEGLGVWSPDGRRIAFVSNRTDEPDGNSNSDIWIVSADNTDRGATLLRVTTNPGSDTSPAWSPDGAHIAYLTVTEPDLIWYATNDLAIVSLEGGEPELLADDLDRNVRSPRFDPNGTSIWFLVEDSAEDHLARLDLSSGWISRPISGSRSVNGFDLGPNGMVASRISELTFPAEIFVGTGKDRERLTHENDAWLSQIQLGSVKNVTFPSEDGTEVEGFITLPVGFEEGLRYPTLLRIHGGPVSQYRHSFNFEAQLFAARGYVVVQTNPRGSSGYGQAFSHDLWAEWGVRDFADVMAGVDYAIEAGYADPDRLGVGGWSYGGILTDHVIVQTDRFKGAITGASEVLYVANYGHDHYQLQWEKELGLPWEGDNRAAWERISPFNRVDRVTTPTLVMGGEKDWNVPIQNGEQLYQALRRLGVPTQLVVYPGQGHGLRVPSYQKDRYERYLAWYDRWVKPVAPPVTDGGVQ